MIVRSWRPLSLRLAGGLQVSLLRCSVQEDGDIVTDDTDQDHDQHNRDKHPVTNSYEGESRLVLVSCTKQA